MNKNENNVHEMQALVNAAQAEPDVKNLSGIRPVEYNCLVLPDEVKEKTAGGLILPDETKERDSFGRVEGVMVAASPLAFTYGEWPDAAAIPKIGDRVMFARYQGVEVQGRDGRKYWMLKDKAIAGVIER